MRIANARRCSLGRRMLAGRRSRVARAGRRSPGRCGRRSPPAQQAEVMRFGDDFKQFIGRAKSAMTFVREAIDVARRQRLQAVAGVAGEGGRACRARDGTRSTAIARSPRSSSAPSRSRAARRIVNTHNDSVRLALQAQAVPRQLRHRAARHDTHGGLKNYQWVNRPLAIDRTGHQDRRHRGDHRHRARAGRSGADDRRPGAARGPRLPRADATATSSRPRSSIRFWPDRATRAAEALKDKYNLTRRRFPVGRSADRARRRCRSTSVSITSWSAHTATTIAPTALPRSGRSLEVETPTKTAIAYGVNNEEVNSWTTGVELRVVPDAAGGSDRGAGAGLQRPDAAPRAARVPGAGVRLHDGPRSGLPATLPAERLRPARLGAGVQGIRRRARGRRRVFRADPRVCSPTPACAGRPTRTAPVTAAARSRSGSPTPISTPSMSASASSACIRRWKSRRRSTSGSCFGDSRLSWARKAAGVYLTKS